MASSTNPPAREGATVDQLKDDIDRNRTGAKVNFSDPAASPLGTNDEAGGTRPSPQLVAQVREREQKIGAMAKEADQAASRPGTWVFLALAAFVVIALVVWTLVAGW